MQTCRRFSYLPLVRQVASGEPTDSTRALTQPADMPIRRTVMSSLGRASALPWKNICEIHERIEPFYATEVAKAAAHLNSKPGVTATPLVQESATGTERTNDIPDIASIGMAKTQKQQRRDLLRSFNSTEIQNPCDLIGKTVCNHGC